MTWEMDLRIMEKRAHEKGKKEMALEVAEALRKKGKRAHEKGKKEMALEVAEALRKKGMSEAEIAEVTGLPEKKETMK